MRSWTAFTAPSTLVSIPWRVHGYMHSLCPGLEQTLLSLKSPAASRRLWPTRSRSLTASRRPTTATMAENHVVSESQTPTYMRSYRGEILCNRALNMSKIKAIGFDMDYTLAMYFSEEFETLAASSALQKLVHSLGYPKALLSVKYDHSYFIRGLVVDKDRGNIIKLDRHKYVKRAMHGFKVLSKEERSDLYDKLTVSGGGFGEPRFAVLDAMFALPDAFLFSSIVKYKDDHPEEIAQDYRQIYSDVRKSVDMCHRDGSIKDEVSENPHRYIERDGTLVPMLRKLKRSGRKVFLLTNSLWNYTDAVMKYLYAHEKEGKWIDLFDVIISGSAKPAFLVDPRLPLYRCDPENGLLKNTEGVFNEAPEEYLKRGNCFQGGNYTHLHSLLGVSSGTQLLYVGDHIFSDVVRSKRTLGWRTMLIVPELEHEINTLYDDETVKLGSEIQERRDARDALDEWVDRLEGDLVGQEQLAEDQDRLVRSELCDARNKLQVERAEIADRVEQYHRRFHREWGQLFKTGLQNSRFAEQVEDYACLYTSKVTNIGFVSPEIYWRAMSDLMPHDRLMSSPMRRLLSKRLRLAGDGQG